ncbi:MAG: TetR/AcrR family transcriptional regulator [Solirubrobacteraceae bacterium]
MSLPSTEPTSLRRYASKTADERREERRRRMLTAALGLFGTQGYRGTTIEALCAAASVSTRNFYEEFGSREALVIALHDDVNARALKAVIAALDNLEPSDILARVSAATRAYFDVMTSDRRWAQIALVESVGVSPDAEAHRRAAIDRFVTLIEAEASRLAYTGLIERRDYHLTAVALAGALNGLINTWTANNNWNDTVPQIADEATRLILLALTANPSAPTSPAAAR